MAIIPLHVGQRRPKVEQIPQPEPVDGALRGLGDQYFAVAERFQQRMLQQEALDTELARRRLMERIVQAEDDVAQNAAPDGEGLHEAMYGQIDPHTGRAEEPGLFDTLFDEALPNIPESQRAGFARQKEAMRATGSLRIAMRQLQRRKDYEQAHVDTVLQANAIAIGKADPDDPATFEAARQDGLDLIDKMGLDPGIRQQKARDWFGTAAKARFEALIAKDPKRALEMFGVGTPVSGGDAYADTVQAAGSAMLADLSPDTASDLVQQAHAAHAASLIDARTDIAIAGQNAPDAVANTGIYSGTMPSQETFIAVYGVEEGGKRYRDFARKMDVGRRAFGMRIMPNQAVHAALRDAEPGSSQDEDQGHHNLRAEAARQNLSARTADPGGYVCHVFPNVDAAWQDVSKDYQSAVVLSVAAQQQLGIEDIQPLPNSVVEDTVMSWINKYSQRKEVYIANRNLLDEIPDPVMRLSLIKQLIYASAMMAIKY